MNQTREQTVAGDPPLGEAGPTSGNDFDGYENPADAAKALGQHFKELREYATYYIAAKADGIKLSLRNVVLYAILGVLGAIVGIAALSTAAVLLLVGLARGLGHLLWDQLWLGSLLVGLIVLGATGAVVWLKLSGIQKSARDRTVKKYEDRQRQQRIDFGHDVAEVAHRTNGK